jgi:hypothetical protein
MIFGLLRLVGVIWIFGFIVLALAATSSYLYSTESSPERLRRWQTRLRMSLLWPVALLSADGRARLRRG